MRLGFIGLGTMGRPMATHLLDHKYELGVYGRRPEAVVPLVERGAVHFASVLDLAAECDVLFTMVTGTRDVEQLLVGDNGAVHGLRQGGLVIDMSTIDPTVTRTIALHLEDKGVDMLDAPVSGGPQGARDASLSIMVGGSKEVLDRANPLLKCLGTTILHMGESGAGQATKACHQLLMLVTAQGVAEALTLAARCGVDVKLVQQAMMNGMASSRVLDVFGSRMVTRQFDDGIETRLYHKDLQTVLTLARSLGVSLPAGNVVMKFLDELMVEGNDRNDLSVLVKSVERVNQTGSQSASSSLS